MPNDLIMRRKDGKEYVLYKGLLNEAHRQGLECIDTELKQIPTDENGQVAIVKAAVWMPPFTKNGEVPSAEDSRKFTGIGDASPENVGRNIMPHIIRMAECVPLGSEILTQNGWRTHDQLRVGELVLGYDVGLDRCRWVRLLDVTTHDAQPLVSLSGRSFDVACTPDHSWAVRRQRCKGTLRKANDFKTSDSILLAAKAEGGQIHMGERLAAILGWLATDGSLRSRHVKDKYGEWGPYWRADIAQSKPEYIEDIRGLLRDEASEAIVEPRERQMPSGQVSLCQKSYRWNLSSTLIREILHTSGIRQWQDLPSLVLHLDQESREAMLDAMLKGDGSKKANGRWVFGKKRKPGVMEAFELLATLGGYALGGPRMSSTGEVPLRTLRSNRVIDTNHLTVTDEGAARVWCPTTELGTWVMRQNGYITITGNTRAKARALRDAVNVGVMCAEELGGEA